MAYATKQDLIDRFTEAELLKMCGTGAPPAIDETKVAKALADADSEINSRIAGRVNTPVTPVPDILVDRACTIARYKYYADRVTDLIRANYKDALAWLDGVASGRFALGNATAPTTAPSGGAPQIAEGERTFSAETMRGYSS
ncbi:MAG: DUF1320 domain-containing protein [Rhizomicrobium sp.]